MIVFIKNIPNDSIHEELLAFIQPVVKGSLIKKNGNLNSLEILAFKDKVTKIIEFHALANIEPDNVAQRVIKSMHGLVLRGNRITVREYQHRNWHNDRRVILDYVPQIQFTEKRMIHDRRRQLETYKVARPEFI